MITKDKIKEIISSGDYKEKIHLYLTELAIINSGDEAFLTQEQRLEIVGSLKSKEETGYYNKCLEYNRTFLIYKNIIISYVTSINQLCLKHQFLTYSDNYEKLLFICSDKDNVLKNFKLPLPDWLKSSSSETIITDINREVHILKSIIELNKKAIKKYLPLKPYLDFLKEAEKEVKNDVKELDELIRKVKFLYGIQASAFKRKKEPTIIDAIEYSNYLVDYSKIDVYISNEEIKNYIVR
jgi:hypothetical protein